MFAQMIFKDRLSIFDLIYIAVFASLGGWWNLCVIPFAVLSFILQRKFE